MILQAPVATLIDRYLEAFRRYADFGGRSPWRAYLSFFLVNLSIGLALRGLETIVGNGFFGLLGLLYGFAVLIPGLAITVRFVRSLLID